MTGPHRPSRNSFGQHSGSYRQQLRTRGGSTRCGYLRSSRRANRTSSRSGGPDARTRNAVPARPGFRLAATADAGSLSATNPSSSFFYVLTASHAFHLLGGVRLWYMSTCRPAAAPRAGQAHAIDAHRDLLAFLDAGSMCCYLMVLILAFGGKEACRPKSPDRQPCAAWDGGASPYAIPLEEVRDVAVHHLGRATFGACCSPTAICATPPPTGRGPSNSRSIIYAA